jgi:putative ABC transport system substrate-binding protein
VNTRRKIIVALGAGALVTPFVSFAQQQGKIWRIGYLDARRRPAAIETDYADSGAFPLGMRELGYVEGKNMIIEWRFADGKTERLPELAVDLVQSKVDVIVTAGTPATGAAQKATTTIPIVMATVVDPVGSGFIKSLPHPGGNITGLANLTPETTVKHLDLLRSLVPKLSRVAVLLNPANLSHATILKNAQVAAQEIGIKILPIEAQTPREIENAFAMISRQAAQAVIVARDAIFNQQRVEIAEQALKYRMPSVFSFRQHAEAGGLMSYGQSRADSFRRAAVYVDKILKGTKPSELPVEQPTIFELVVNMKTAKALGIKIPNSILVRADRVIE